MAPLPPGVKLIWCAIKSRQGHGKSTWANLATIGERLINQKGNPTDKATVSRAIKLLEKHGFVEIKGKYITCKYNENSLPETVLSVDEKSTNVDERSTESSEKALTRNQRPLTRDQQGVDEKSTTVDERSTRTEKGTIKKEQQKGTIKKSTGKRFTKPSLEELETYFLEKLIPPLNYSYRDEAERFKDYYESNGWRVGRNSMKDWKAAVRNWLRNIKNKPSQTNGTTSKKTGRARPAGSAHEVARIYDIASQALGAAPGNSQGSDGGAGYMGRAANG